MNCCQFFFNYHYYKLIINYKELLMEILYTFCNKLFAEIQNENTNDSLDEVNLI